MNENLKVFASNITRTNTKRKNNFNEIISIVPAVPIPVDSINDSTFQYKPRSDKYYVSKKRSGLKVKTVKDIRNIFEKDVYCHLPMALEKQQQSLFHKIKLGSLKTDATKEFAKNVLNNEDPISMSAWHMLMNINPYEHKYPTQFVLWNGKYVQINGSKGGNRKFICKRDIGRSIIKSNQKVYALKSSGITKNRNLLHNSLKAKFKPGPLTKKKYLDTSYQKYQFGDIELVTLPKLGLEVQPVFDKPLGPSLSSFLYKTFMPDFNCVVSPKWAEFSVSVLGSNINGKTIQLDKKCNISFDLSYKFSQNRLLMRHDSDMLQNKENTYEHFTKINNENSCKEDMTEIEKILKEIVNAVEININQDIMYTGVDEPREIPTIENNSNTNSVSRPKRKYGELDRLDVTIIRISETTNEDNNDYCMNDYCTLGCICNSLRSNVKVKPHCGNIECMFYCTCGFSTYDFSTYIENSDPKLISEYIHIDKNKNIKLAKEEQKFHQTVIVTDNKSILLKSRKRDCKTPKKYADFYSNLHSKPESIGVKDASVIILKLNLTNIEPFCMVHKLYKCFCKATFTSSSINVSVESTKVNDNPSNSLDSDLSSSKSEEISSIEGEHPRFRNLRPRPLYKQQKLSENSDLHQSQTANVEISDKLADLDICARTQSFGGRKHNDGYYYNTNEKIKNIEKYDKTLQTKLINRIHRNEVTQNSDSQNTLEITPSVPNLKELLTSFIESDLQGPIESTTTEKISSELNTNCRRLPHKTKLVTWLEHSYKQYKLKAEQGITKICMEAPKAGKLALYPWDFILSRYSERKNYFLSTKQKPFRIFLAIDIRNSFFEKCINISDIGLEDLHQYPITVQNLIMNAADLLDNFCILNGLSHCWELIGSVTKVNEKNTNSLQYAELLDENASDSNGCHKSIPWDIPEINDETSIFATPKYKCDVSKWFIIVIENDFDELQLSQKGFFVTYNSIIKAINVARVSKKTVRLSSEKNCFKVNDLQFGIHAVPIEENHCVYVGPYEINESLGIDMINKQSTGIKVSRGLWVIVNKKENIDVIDNPHLYMPSENNHSKMTPLANEKYMSMDMTDGIISRDSKKYTKNMKQQSIPKLNKPIKISKKNNIFHLRPNSLLKSFLPIAVNKTLLNTPIDINNQSFNKSKISMSKISCNDESSTHQSSNLIITQKSIGDKSPEVKSSTESVKTPSTNKRECNMFVLKPEEINKRILETMPVRLEPKPNHDIDNNMQMDIENFLADSLIKNPPDSDVCIISDDDEEENLGQDMLNNKVYIVCKNVGNIGWIPGKRKSDGSINFQFPGLKETKYYSEKQAFEKINQVLSRKVYVSKNLTLEWRVCEHRKEILFKPKLRLKDLNPNYFVTRKGLRHKPVILNDDKKSINCSKEEVTSSNISFKNFMNEKDSVIQDLEKTSTALETECDKLWNAALKNQEEITTTLVEASDDQRKRLNEQLTYIYLSDNNENTYDDT